MFLLEFKDHSPFNTLELFMAKTEPLTILFRGQSRAADQLSRTYERCLICYRYLLSFHFRSVSFIH